MAPDRWRGADVRGTYVEWRKSAAITGTVVKWLAVAMVIPLAVSVIYGRDVWVFLASMAVFVGVGGGLERLESDVDLGPREALLLVALAWGAVSVVGAVPYLLAGWGTPSTLAHPLNALFESTSGFTTTGATVMGEISLDRHSHGLLIWRQLSQWLGGMGIVVLAVAILPELSVGGAQLMDAEAPGPGIEKLTPRIAETARVLWIAYFAFTVLEMALLFGLNLAGFADEMTLFNAISHGLTTLPTGGFSPEAYSIEAFSAAVQWVIIPFMVVAGTNFALFWRAFDEDGRVFSEDSEFRFYAGVMAVLSAVLAGLLFSGVGPGLATIAENVLPIPGNVERSLRHAIFQVVSIVTTTGYASMDFNTWSDLAKITLLFAMFLGGSAGSAAGGIKIIRWYVVSKSVGRELFTTIHPEAVRPIRIGKRAADEETIRGIFVFVLAFLVIFVVSTVLLYLDAVRVGVEMNALEAASMTIATLGNVGPGFGQVGPMNSYEPFSVFSKLYMVFLMWIGRLEILSVLVILTPSYWRH